MDKPRPSPTDQVRRIGGVDPHTVLSLGLRILRNKNVRIEEQSGNLIC